MDYDNEWDGEHDVWHGACSHASNDAWFCCLQKRHIPLDMVYLSDDTALADLLHYKHIIYPHGAILTEKIIWEGRTASAPIYNEILTPTDGAPVGYFQNNCYDGAPAIVHKATGKGQAYYVGSAFAEDTAALVSDMAGIQTPLGLGNVLALPETVELAVREKAGTRYVFLLNYQDSPAKITLQKPMKELLSGQTLQGACEIGGYGCLVFEWEA